MKPRSHRPFSIAIALGCLLLLFAAASATAATRFAAPGGQGADPCDEPAKPCSLFTAAHANARDTTIGAGDEVVLAPGVYHSNGNIDLGPQNALLLPPGVSLRGPARGEEATILQELSNLTAPVITVRPGGLVSQIHIVSRGGPGIEMDGGTVERVLVETSHEETIACSQSDGGVLRDSVCLSSGAKGVGVGVNSPVPPSLVAGDVTTRLRNVTAIASSDTGFGLRYLYSGGSYTVDALSVIAQGGVAAQGGADVQAIAAGTSLRSTQVRIGLRNSAYDSRSAITRNPPSLATFAEVTVLGTSGNITLPPRLFGDGFHQIQGSPTINAGATDGISGTLDIDGNRRNLGGVADIGADEFATATETLVGCEPASVAVGSNSTCTAVVVELSSGPGTPPGEVRFSHSGVGTFSNNGVCTLVPVVPVDGLSASCQITYTPREVGSDRHRITASYVGGSEHEDSVGLAGITVTAAPGPGPGPGPGPNPGPGPGPGPNPGPGPGPGPNLLTPRPATPQTTIKLKPKKLTAARRARFTFASDQAGSRFECKLDKIRYKDCASPFKVAKLKKGGHVLLVRAINPQGLVDPTPAVHKWKVGK